MQTNATYTEAHANQGDFTRDLSGVLGLFTTCGDVFRHQTALQPTCTASRVPSQHDGSFMKWFTGSGLLKLFSISLSLSLSQNEIYILMSFQAGLQINQLKRSMFSCRLLLSHLRCYAVKGNWFQLSFISTSFVCSVFWCTAPF